MHRVLLTPHIGMQVISQLQVWKANADQVQPDLLPRLAVQWMYCMCTPVQKQFLGTDSRFHDYLISLLQRRVIDSLAPY